MNEDYSTGTGGSMIIIERLQDECYKSYLKFLRQCSYVSPGNQQEIKVGDMVLHGEGSGIPFEVKRVFVDETGDRHYLVGGKVVRRDEVNLLTPIE